MKSSRQSASSIKCESASWTTRFATYGMYGPPESWRDHDCGGGAVAQLLAVPAMIRCHLSPHRQIVSPAILARLWANTWEDGPNGGLEFRRHYRCSGEGRAGGCAGVDPWRPGHELARFS